MAVECLPPCGIRTTTIFLSFSDRSASLHFTPHLPLYSNPLAPFLTIYYISKHIEHSWAFLPPSWQNPHLYYPNCLTNSQHCHWPNQQSQTNETGKYMKFTNGRNELDAMGFTHHCQIQSSAGISLLYHSHFPHYNTLYYIYLFDSTVTLKSWKLPALVETKYVMGLA